MTPLTWLILLLLLGVIFILLELFIPSGGVLAFCAAVCLVGVLVAGFYYYGPATGTILLAVEAILVPVLIVVAIRVWPYTPVGRLVLNRPPGEIEVEPGAAESAEQLRELVGKWGRAKSPLLPSGAVLIDGRLYDAVSRDKPIEAGQPIEVVQAEGNHIVVCLSSHSAPPDAQREENKNDILAQPAESLGIEPLEDPLG